MCFVIVFFVGFVAVSVDASLGDRSPDFVECARKCQSACRTPNEPEISSWNRLLGWTCADECKYDCMHQVTNDDIRYGRPVRQFYGKWPFVRIFGVQEVASTIFSVANCLVHVSALRRYRSRVPRRYRLYWVWQANSLVSIHAWVWSTIFHARDVPFTERMDYFAATSLIVMQVFCQQMRIVGGSRPARNAVSWLLGAIDASVYAFYVYSMTFIRFDYGFNINFNVTLGVLMMCTWFGWCFVCKDKQPYVWKCVLFLLLLFSAMGLELGDFPPVFGLFDAHSLWHLATIPLPLLWYSFVVDDARYELKEQSVVLGRL